ncbi:MAG: ADOP family duplicated permease [Vicinamibacterales bacterium]
MRLLSDMLFRLRTLVHRTRAEAELDEELAFHLEMQARALREQGWTPEAAAAEARRRLGVLSRETQRARDAWGLAPLLDLGADVRVALRQLRRRPGFTAIGVGTLALGLAASVALSSVAVGLLVRPMPVTDEARLQVFWSDYNWRGEEFDFVKERQQAFSGLAAFSNEGYTLRVGDQSAMVLATVSSAELFDVLGARPLMGRTFQPGEDRPGAPAVTVVSYGFWQQELGADPDVLGRRLDIDGAPVEVVGVMPPGFYFPSPMFRIWRPLRLDPADPAYAGNGWLVLVGRERAGLARGELDADIQRIAAALGQRFTYPEAWDKTKGASVQPLRTYTRGAVRPAVLLLQAAVLLVLGIACANVAALVLARTSDRAEELAVRTALGAGRWRLVRQIVAESLVLAGLAGVAGAALAAGVFRALVARLPLPDGLEDTLVVDWGMFAVTVALVALVGVVVALAPVRAVLTGKVQGPGRERSAGGLSLRAPRRVHDALVAAEVALAVALVAGAALFTRSVHHLYAIDAGFETPHVAAMDLVAPTQIMPADARAAFFDQAIARVQAVPGVRAAGFVTRLPLRDGGWQGTVTIEDRPDLRDGREPNALFRIVSPGYFPAMGIDIVRGRGFGEADGAGAPPVALVSASFAERMWPGRDPIGRRLQHRFEEERRWVTVVGVVEETRMTRMTGDNPLVLYVPLAQSSAPEGPVLVVKGDGGDPPLAALRAAVRETDPRVAIGRVTTLEAVVATAVAEPLRLRFFLTVLGALALLIGAAGIYSVVSYSVTRRRAEFGVRLALGASPRRHHGHVLASGLRPVALGVVTGLAATLAAGSVAARFLFGVAPSDASSLAAAAAVLLATGVLAAVVPALSAGRTDPVEALRAE